MVQRRHQWAGRALRPAACRSLGLALCHNCRTADRLQLQPGMLLLLPRCPQHAMRNVNVSSAPLVLQGGPQQPAAVEAALPPEVERLMRFTDAPQETEEEQGWLRVWRDQGP